MAAEKMAHLGSASIKVDDAGRCPSCSQNLSRSAIPGKAGTLELELCTGCFLCWIEPHDYDQLSAPSLGGWHNDPETLVAWAEAESQGRAIRTRMDLRADTTLAHWVLWEWRLWPVLFGRWVWRWWRDRRAIARQRDQFGLDR